MFAMLQLYINHLQLDMQTTSQVNTCRVHDLLEKFSSTSRTCSAHFIRVQRDACYADGFTSTSRTCGAHVIRVQRDACYVDGFTSTSRTCGAHVIRVHRDICYVDGFHLP